jgi:hypothetical protein
LNKYKNEKSLQREILFETSREIRDYLEEKSRILKLNVSTKLSWDGDFRERERGEKEREIERK